MKQMITEKQIKKLIRESNDYDKAERIKAQAMARLAVMEFYKKHLPDRVIKNKESIRNFLYKYIAEQDSISWFIENREKLLFIDGIEQALIELDLSETFKTPQLK